MPLCAVTILLLLTADARFVLLSFSIQDNSSARRAEAFVMLILPAKLGNVGNISINIKFIIYLSTF